MRLIILGAGGHGRVVADLAEQIDKYDEIVFLDDNSNDDRVIGKCSDYIKFKGQGTEMYPDLNFIMHIANHPIIIMLMAVYGNGTVHKPSVLM